jgi:protein O-mannosyl-transferase
MNEATKKSLIRWCLCLLVAAITLLVYLPAVNHPYINLDDPAYIINNFHVRQGMTWSTVRWAFTSVDNNNWHPLTTLSHALVWQVYGPEPLGQHEWNVILHVVNAVLVFLFALKLFQRQWLALALALLFALQPMHVESVAWISERKDVLSGLFFLLTVLAYLRFAELTQSNSRRGWGTYGATLFFFACGLMSKPMLVTTPVILLLLDFWPLGRIRNWKLEIGNWKWLLLEKIPFVLLSLGSCYVTLWAQATALKREQDFPLLDRLAHVATAYVWYLQQFIWPWEHSIYYVLHVEQPLMETLLAAALLSLCIVLFIRQANPRPYLLVGWLWFLVMLVPVIGFVQAGNQAYAERYTYLPYLGLLIIVGGLGIKFWPGNRWRQVVAGVLIGGYIGLNGWWTIQQIHVWDAAGSLFQQAIKQDDQNEEGWLLYGLDLNHVGKPEEAVKCVRKALDLNPNDIEAEINLGRILTQQGKYDEAQSIFEVLIVTSQYQRPLIYKQYGELFVREEKKPEAISNLEKSLELDSDQPVVVSFLAKLYAETGQWEKSADLYKQNISLLGDNFESEAGLATACFQSRDYAQAIEHYRQAIALKPDLAEARNNLAWLLATCADAGLRDGQAAVSQAQKACELTRYHQTQYIGTLAAAYAEAGDFNQAIANAQKACALAEKNGETNLLTRNQQLLEQYRRHQPVREP